eukprot:12607223-Alexandrium_andersonii.AAC.1
MALNGQVHLEELEQLGEQLKTMLDEMQKVFVNMRGINHMNTKVDSLNRAGSPISDVDSCTSAANALIRQAKQ